MAQATAKRRVIEWKNMKKLKTIMNTKSFIATTGNGLARATQDANGVWANSDWDVEFHLEDLDVRCLAADPLGVVYAGTQGDGVLRSDDRGKTWQAAGLAGVIVKSLASSPIERGTIYAGTKPARIYVSRDSGAHWSELDSFRRIGSRWMWVSPAEPPFFTAYVQGIALSPTDSKVIVAGIEAGAVVRSEDGGVTWSDHCSGALRDCHTLTFHPKNGNWVYEAGGSGAGAAVSRDGGKTWKQPRDGLDRHYGWACAVDPSQPEVWYLSASPGFSFAKFAPLAHVDGQANAYIFRSAGGAPWQRLSGGLPQPLDYMAYALLTDPAAPGHLYTGLSNGDVWHSEDHGDTWGMLPFNLKGIHRAMIMV